VKIGRTHLPAGRIGGLSWWPSRRRDGRDRIAEALDTRRTATAARGDAWSHRQVLEVDVWRLLGHGRSDQV
jgi:hypothetical protein